MSTRSQFGFYEKDTIDIWKTKPLTILYKHWDGYPTGNLPLIFSFLKRYFHNHTENKIYDMEYFSAWFLYYIINDHIKSQKKMRAQYASSNIPKDGIDFSGYGVCKQLHYDIEYYYAFTPKYLIVYNVSVFSKTFHIIFKASLQDLVIALNHKTRKTYPYSTYEPYLSKFEKNETLKRLCEFMENAKTRNSMEVFDLRNDEENNCIDIGYQIINILDMPHEDLPTMISHQSPLINALVKCRLDHNI